MTPAQAEALIEAAAQWVRSREDLRALGLAGSWARGAARSDSDIDLVVLTESPAAFRADRTWLPAMFPEPFGIRREGDEDYGAVWTRRVFLDPDAEVELNFAPRSWAATNPVDPGTRRVVSDGFRIIIDKDGALQRLVEAISA